MENVANSSHDPQVEPASARRLVVATSLLLACAGGAAVACAGAVFMGVEAGFCLLLGVLILAPVAVRWGTGTFDLFEPIVIIAAVYFIYFVVGPLVRIGMDDLTFIGRSFEADYLPALLAVLVAVLAMWLGYALPVGPEAATTDAPPSETALAVRYGRRMAAVLLVLAFLGMVLWARVAGRSLAFFFLPGLSRSTDSAEGGVDVPYLFFMVEWFVPAMTVLVLTDGMRGRFARVGLIGLVTIVYASLGFRYRVVVLWLAIGMAAYLRAGRRPRLLHLAVPGAVAFLFSGWLVTAREFFRSGGAYGSLRFDSRGILLAGLSDTRIFDALGSVIAAVPRFSPYAGITPFVYPLLLPVPRLVWPDKPVPYWLHYVGQSIGTPGAIESGPAIPHFGEFYIAFGWAGIAVGMFVFGVAAKWLWRWFRAAPADPFRQAVFALNTALLFQVIIRGYLAQIFQEWCFLVLPAIVIAGLARRKARRTLSVASAAPVEAAVGA